MKNYIYFVIYFQTYTLYLNEKPRDNFFKSQTRIDNKETQKFIIEKINSQRESPCISFEFNNNNSDDEKQDRALLKRKINNELKKKNDIIFNKITFFKNKLFFNDIKDNFDTLQSRAIEFKKRFVDESQGYFHNTRVGKKKTQIEECKNNKKEHALVDNIFENMKNNLDECKNLRHLVVDEFKQEEDKKENILEFCSEEEMNFLIYMCIFYTDMMNKIENLESAVESLDSKQKNLDQSYYSIVAEVRQNNQNQSDANLIMLKNIKYHYLNIFLTILTLSSVIGNIVYSNYK